MLQKRLEELSLESLDDLAERHDVEIPEGATKQEYVELILEALEEDRLERELHNNNPVNIEEKKYRLLAGDELEDYWQDVDVDLPEHYNDTRLVLLLRDPAWAFAYWDIRDSTVEDLEREEDRYALILRVYELGDNAHAANDGKNGKDGRNQIRDSFDIPIQKDDREWYVHLPKQKTTYRLDLIRRSDWGDQVLATSNSITVPRGGIADPDDGVDGTTDQILAYSGVQKLDIADYDRAVPQRIISLAEEHT
jgi:hypothetical protein